MFKAGDKVVFGFQGLGTVTGLGQRDIDGRSTEVINVQCAYATIAIPVDRAGDSLRPPIDVSTAQAWWDALVAPEVPFDGVALAARTEQVMRLAKEGRNADAVPVLRQLYGMTGPMGFGEKRLVFTLEDVLLGEISFVLGRPRAELERDLQERHPARRW